MTLISLHVILMGFLGCCNSRHDCCWSHQRSSLQYEGCWHSNSQSRALSPIQVDEKLRELETDKESLRLQVHTDRSKDFRHVIPYLGKTYNFTWMMPEKFNPFLTISYDFVNSQVCPRFCML